MLLDPLEKGYNPVPAKKENIIKCLQFMINKGNSSKT
jgi:hypothetical protein